MKYFISLIWCLIFFSCSLEDSSYISLQKKNQLYNTQWLFKAFEVVGDTIETLPFSEQYFLFFKEGLQGNTDNECINWYAAEYSIRPPNNITIGDINSSRALCRESYWRYLNELKQSAHYEIDGNTLYLWSHDSVKRLVFTRVQQLKK